MKLLITGGRDFNDTGFIAKRLNDIHSSWNITKLIHGMASGADTISGNWAEQNNVQVEKYPAKWNLYGKSAGYLRNKEMLEKGKPDYLLAFPGGKGTSNMVNLCVVANVPMWISKWLYFKKEDPQYWFLSNFATGFGFEDKDGKWWSTSEHYYQAMKTPNYKDRERIRLCRYPNEAKNLGRTVITYSDWDTKKFDVMRDALRYKFSDNSKAANLLISTSMDYLVEYAPWGDIIWGVDKQLKGENNLGKLLMERRDELLSVSHKEII